MTPPPGRLANADRESVTLGVSFGWLAALTSTASGSMRRCCTSVTSRRSSSGCMTVPPGVTVLAQEQLQPLQRHLDGIGVGQMEVEQDQVGLARSPIENGGGARLADTEPSFLESLGDG